MPSPSEQGGESGESAARRSAFTSISFPSLETSTTASTSAYRSLPCPSMPRAGARRRPGSHRREVLTETFGVFSEGLRISCACRHAAAARCRRAAEQAHARRVRRDDLGRPHVAGGAHSSRSASARHRLGGRDRHIDAEITNHQTFGTTARLGWLTGWLVGWLVGSLVGLTPPKVKNLPHYLQRRLFISTFLHGAEGIFLKRLFFYQVTNT